MNSFVGDRGLTFLADVVDIENGLEYFQLIITDDILGIVPEETNRYADQFFQAKAGVLPTHSRANNWKPLTLLERKTFPGLTIATGIIDKKGHFAYYWSKNPIVSTPFFGKTMSRKRY